MNEHQKSIVEKEDLILFSNGPGEISTWVFPIAERIKNHDELRNRYNIVLIIHPCQFSSGTEHIYASKLSLFDRVITSSDYLKLLFGLNRIKRYGLKRRGIIISLGGDLLHPVLFKFRSRGNYQLYAYTNNPGWIKRYEKIFVRSEYVKNKSTKKGKKDSSDKIFVTGDLVYSSIKVFADRNRVRSEISVLPDDLMVIFMPGSRDFEVKYMLPVYLKVINVITNEFKTVKPFILRSPYVDNRLIESSLKSAPNIKEVKVETGKLVEFKEFSSTNVNFAIKTSSKRMIPILEGGLEYWGRGVDLAVTVPGTNTVQLAYRGIPALVVAALNKPEIIPIEGFAGLLKWLPGGKMLLKKAVKKYIKNFPFASLPNIYMRKEILPELFGVIKTEDIVERLQKILKENELVDIKNKLMLFNFNNDPADTIISEIFKV